jgi:hypothetical protein
MSNSVEARRVRASRPLKVDQGHRRMTKGVVSARGRLRALHAYTGQALVVTAFTR